MDNDPNQLGLTAPTAREVETVTTRTETRTSHAPRRASQLPLTLDESSFAGDASSGDYALLRLAPAITTTVVTTTTQTKTTFAPIRIPRSRAIRPAYSSFSGPSGADAPRSTVPLSPKTSFRRFAELEQGEGAASSSALKLDPRMYPLSQAKWPEGMKQFGMDLGGMKAHFYDEAAQAPAEVSTGSSCGARLRDTGGKGKGRAVESEGAEVEDAFGSFGMAPSLSRSERGSLAHRRTTRRGRNSVVSPTDQVDDVSASMDECSTSDLAAPSHHSPGPPRKRARADSPPLDPLPPLDSQLDFSSSASATARAAAASRRPSQAHAASFVPTTPLNPNGATTLPSPNQSPPSPVPTFSGEESQDLKDDGEEMHDQLEPVNPQAFDFGTGAAFSGLLSLPDLVNTFDQLPQSLQSYLMFQLLRRSSIPVLQTLNQIIEPSLRRDFLSDLPPELGVHVLCYLDAKTLCRAALVSKKWRRLIDGEWKIWKDQLLHEGLWIGDGSEEKEAREIASGSAENLFLKRWKAGVWDMKRPCVWNGKVDAENLYVSGVGGDARRPSISHRLASPSSSRETSPVPVEHVVHPFKLLYRRRYLTRRNWKYNTPKRTTFPSAPVAQQANAANPNNHVVTCLQFDKDKVVSASDDHAINVFDTQTGVLKASLTGHEGGVWALQYVGNVLVSGSTDRTVRVWDLDTGRCTHTFIGHTSTVRCLQIVQPQNVNPDPRGPPTWQPPYPLIVTGSRDWSLRVWKLPMPGKDEEYHPVVPQSPTEENTAPSQNPYHLKHLSGHHHAVRALAAHCKTLVSGSYDMDVRVWDLPSGKLRHRLQGHSQKVYSVVYDHLREQCASGSMDGTVRLWSTDTGECRAVLEGHTSLVGLLGLTHRNLVSAAADWTLRIWDPEDGRCKHALAAHQGAITCFQHDEHKIISGSDGTLKMWDVSSGELVRDLLTNLTGVWQVSFDQRFCVAAVSRNNISEFEVLDFGSVDPEPLTRDVFAPSTPIKEEDDEDGFPAPSAADVTMEDFADSQDTTGDDSSATPLVPPAAPHLRPSGFTSLPSASSSTASLLSRLGPASSEVSAAAVPSSRRIRRRGEARNLREQARGEEGGVSVGEQDMEVEQDGAGAEDELEEVKTEEV
ncbi:hypothetical protein JCM8547_008956 [Rhodosporidiobolus lusitaniae]